MSERRRPFPGADYLTDDEYAQGVAGDLTMVDVAVHRKQAADNQPTAPACEYREVQDPKYAHLVNPQCACGWSAGGSVKRPVARIFWNSHVATTPRGGK